MTLSVSVNVGAARVGKPAISLNGTTTGLSAADAFWLGADLRSAADWVDELAPSDDEAAVEGGNVYPRYLDLHCTEHCLQHGIDAFLRGEPQAVALSDPGGAPVSTPGSGSGAAGASRVSTPPPPG